MTRFLRNLFGIYALLIFPCTLIVTTLLYVIIFTFFPKKKAPHVAHRLSQFWAKVLSVLFVFPPRIRNKHLIDANKTYVFVANHQSQLDIPVYALACKNTFRFLAKAELTKIPLMGYIIRNLYLTVNRKDRSDRNKSIEIMRQTLEQGISVFLCPEGTRNRYEDPALLEFKDGAFRLAIATQTPVAPFTILNSGRQLSPLHPIALAPGRIFGVWDEPIETAGMTMEDLPALRERVRSQMEGHLREYRSTAK